MFKVRWTWAERGRRFFSSFFCGWRRAAGSPPLFLSFLQCGHSWQITVPRRRDFSLLTLSFSGHWSCYTLNGSSFSSSVREKQNYFENSSRRNLNNLIDRIFNSYLNRIFVERKMLPASGSLSTMYPWWMRNRLASGHHPPSAGDGSMI